MFVKSGVLVQGAQQELLCGGRRGGLRGLLKELLGILEEFVKNKGGLDAVLPLVLRFPPSFVNDDEGDKEEVLK